MDAVFLPRGSVVVNLGWLDDDPTSVDFNAPLGGFHDAFAFPAMADVRTLYYPLPISRTVDTAILSALVSKGVSHFRDGFAVPVFRADNQDPWGQACAALFKADPRTHREMLTDYTTHYCQKYLMKYRNVTTLGQLGGRAGRRFRVAGQASFFVCKKRGPCAMSWSQYTTDCDWHATGEPCNEIMDAYRLFWHCPGRI